jgi:site-specific DNA-methyltransferase (adenine-specific)
MKVTDKIEITNEDNMELMARYPDNYFDLAIVDPPYGININMNQGRRKGQISKHSKKNWDNLPPEKLYWEELKRVSKNQIIWGANNFKWIPPHNGYIVWDKDISGDVDFSKAELAYNSIKNTISIVKIRAQTGIEVYSNKIHPTQKPVALYKWLLDKYAKQGDKILDTHLGSGSIAIACHDYGFELTACELDLEYYEKAVERINNHVAQLKLF